MLNLGGKCVLVCVILLLCGYSFGKPGTTGGKQGSSSPKKQGVSASGGFAAQIAAKMAAQAARDSLARLDSLAKADSLARLDSLVRLDSISRAAEAAHQDSVARVEAARQDSIARAESARQEAIARQEAMARANAPPYPHYEAYLDSMEAYVRYLLPGIDRLDSARKAASEETLKPKSDYETQAAYEQRAANFDKNKQQKIDNLEKEYLEKETGINKLVTAASLKEDFQPDWGSLLEKNSNADGYKARIDTLSYKVNEMNVKIAQLNRQLGRLIMTKRDSAKVAKNLQEKNFIYMSRLKKAGVVMQDYILQEQAKILRTDRKKVDMSLSAYDVERQEFDFGMRDIYSEKYPFDYVGKVKIPTAYAEIIDRRTDDFTVSIDYVNYPLIVNGGKVFPGAKKAYVFYKDMEFENNGMFRNVEGFESVAGYLEWALRVDSLISGKLVPQDLDASYAMTKTKFKEDTGPSWWTAPRIVRVIAFTLSATSLGLAIWKHTAANSKLDEAKKTFAGAEDIIASGDYSNYQATYDKYNDQKKDLSKIENLRNIFYISAGAFGVIGLVSLSF